MDWVILAVMVLMFGIIARRLTLLEQRVRETKESVDSARPRQHNMTARKAMQAAPGVDARARTVRRDTDDLPRTGRQSKTVKRVEMTDD